MSALAVAAPDVPIPASHLDLLERPMCGVLTTLGPTGQPESSLVWVDTDGRCARVNTTLERRKGRNLLARPRMSLLVVDPDDTSRFIQIRGDAELVTEGAIEAPGRADPGLHDPSRLLRPHRPAGAARARDPGHRSHPRAPHHARRHPPLTADPDREVLR